MKRVKQVLIVRKDLGMRKGKIGAQCAHASLGAVLSKMQPLIGLEHPGEVDRILTCDADSPLNIWLTEKFTKICVYVNSEEELIALETKAKEAELIHCLITDAGDTEFHGVPTKTVLAIGPAFVDDLDPITGHLPLY